MTTAPAVPREVGNPAPETPTNPAAVVTPHYPGTHHGHAIYSGHRIEGIDAQAPLPESDLVPHVPTVDWNAYGAQPASWHQHRTYIQPESHGSWGWFS